MSDPTKTPGPPFGPGGVPDAGDAPDGGNSNPSGPGGASRPGPAGPASPPSRDCDASSEPLESDAPVSTSAEGEREPETSVADVDLEALLAQAEKADEYLGLAQRTKADFENYRRRAVREAAAAQERGAIKLAMELLPAIDNLDRALAHADTAENGAADFVSGIKHVRADVISALERVGIEPYSPEGQPFDPQFHEAVAQQPVEGAQPGTVVEVFQRGYRLGDSVLRPARVVVAG